MAECPVCGAAAFSVLVEADKLAEECRVRERFIQQHLTRPASHSELKDLTEFFHQENADLLVCSTCALLVRDKHELPPAQSYAQDEYDPTVMERLYPQYLASFRRKEVPYRSLLPPAARVLEIGSHYGAFLQTAREWGWCAEGIDIGQDTSRFAQSRGFIVHRCELQDCNYPNSVFDGVFIWNCFEQIDDPKLLLSECRRILKPDGLLTVRTPNGLFYTICKKLLVDPNLPSDTAAFLLEAMGYNNLLGFPYLYGHHRATLERLIAPFGFRPQGMLNSELLTLPLPDHPEWVEREERAVNAEMRILARSVLADDQGALTAPWIEVWFRAEP